jgi:hypothetical protein
MKQSLFPLWLASFLLLPLSCSKPPGSASMNLEIAEQADQFTVKNAGEAAVSNLSIKSCLRAIRSPSTS